MREASHRAARAAAKGGSPNAWFGVAAAEALPSTLDGRVHELRVTLPWGSLLRAIVGAEPWFLDATERVLRPAGVLRALVSVTPTDRVPGTLTLDEARVGRLVDCLTAAGWRVREARAATAADVVATGSSWAKRLGVPTRRPAWVLDLQPPCRPSASGGWP